MSRYEIHLPHRGREETYDPATAAARAREAELDPEAAAVVRGLAWHAFYESEGATPTARRLRGLPNSYRAARGS